MIDKYLKATYKDGARGEDGCYDCWGMTREARVVLYGRQMMDSRGGEYQNDPAGFTERYREQIAEMDEVATPTPGSVIAILRKKYICTHVALVIHDVNRTGLGLHVLEINPRVGARIVPLYRFLKEHQMRGIRFYDDKGLSEQA